MRPRFLVDPRSIWALQQPASLEVDCICDLFAAEPEPVRCCRSDGSRATALGPLHLRDYIGAIARALDVRRTELALRVEDNGMVFAAATTHRPGRRESNILI